MGVLGRSAAAVVLVCSLLLLPTAVVAAPPARSTVYFSPLKTKRARAALAEELQQALSATFVQSGRYLQVLGPAGKEDFSAAVRRTNADSVRQEDWVHVGGLAGAQVMVRGELVERRGRRCVLDLALVPLAGEHPGVAQGRFHRPYAGCKAEVMTSAGELSEMLALLEGQVPPPRSSPAPPAELKPEAAAQPKGASAPVARAPASRQATAGPVPPAPAAQPTPFPGLPSGGAAALSGNLLRLGGTLSRQVAVKARGALDSVARDLSGARDLWSDPPPTAFAGRSAQVSVPDPWEPTTPLELAFDLPRPLAAGTVLLSVTQRVPASAAVLPLDVELRGPDDSTWRVRTRTPRAPEGAPGAASAQLLVPAFSLSELGAGAYRLRVRAAEGVPGVVGVWCGAVE